MFGLFAWKVIYMFNQLSVNWVIVSDVFMHQYGSSKHTQHHHVPGLFKKKKKLLVSSPVLFGKQNLSRVPLGHNHFSHTTSHQWRDDLTGV